MQFAINLANANPVGVKLRSGVYKGQIVSAEDKDTKKGGKMLAITVKATHPADAVGTARINLNYPGPDSKAFVLDLWLTAIMSILGLADPQQARNMFQGNAFDPCTAFAGRPCFFKHDQGAVAVTKDDGTTAHYDDTTFITPADYAVFTSGGTSQAAAPTGQAAAFPGAATQAAPQAQGGGFPGGGAPAGGGFPGAAAPAGGGFPGQGGGGFPAAGGGFPAAGGGFPQ